VTTQQSAHVFPEEQVAGSGPVGKGGHVVRDGECISSLAAQNGLLVADIFDHPANVELKAVRGDPNILLTRDRLTIPPVERKKEDHPTGQKTTFVLAGEPVFLRIQLLDRDRPLDGKPFTLVVGGLTIQDTTKPDGTLEARIPPGATTGLLRVGTGADLIQITLKLGALSPVASNEGVQERLQNLGFDCGPIDGIVGPLTRGAVRHFQAKFGLAPDGILGPPTRALLKEKHGC